MQPVSNPHRQQRFTEFLDSIIRDDRYTRVVTELRAAPKERFYEEMRWHGIEDLLTPFPEALEALHGFAFDKWDVKFGSFSACNLKALYIPDEDFVNGGRAFILFNLVASNWTYVGQVANQEIFWQRTK